MTTSVSHLRKNIFKMIDEVIKTGIPIEIERHDHIIEIKLAEPKSKLANLMIHPDCIVGDPEELVHLDWSHEWKGKKLP